MGIALKLSYFVVKSISIFCILLWKYEWLFGYSSKFCISYSMTLLMTIEIQTLWIWLSKFNPLKSVLSIDTPREKLNSAQEFVRIKSWLLLIFSLYLLRGCLHEISFWGKWNIFISVSGQSLITVYMTQPELKLVVGLISLQSFWQKWNFISVDKICKQHPKWNHIKINICACVSKNDWLLVNGPLTSDHPRNEIHFISPVMESNVYGIPFMVGWNFISGRFHFGSHVNTLLINQLKFHNFVKLRLKKFYNSIKNTDVLKMDSRVRWRNSF